MKNVILTIGLLLSFSLALNANDSLINMWEDGSTEFSVGSVTVFTYNRYSLSASDQDRLEVKEELIKGVCSNPDLKQTINSGFTYVYHFVYEDGTITVKLNNCNGY